MCLHSKMCGLCVLMLVTSLAGIITSTAAQPRPPSPSGCTYSPTKREVSCLATSAATIAESLGNLSASAAPGASPLHVDTVTIMYSDIPYLGRSLWAGLAIGNLYVRRNNIRSIAADSFTGIHNDTLININLSENLIEELPDGIFSLQNNVVSVNFSFNQLKAISSALFQMPILREVDLKNNMIDTIAPNAFREATELRTLTLRGNRIASLPDALFSANVNMETLDMSDNFLEVIPNNFLANLTNITEVDLSKNRLRAIQSNTFLNSTIGSQANRSIVKLYLQRNRISLVDADAFKYLSSLVNLDLSSNNLTSLRFLNPLHNLLTIDLSRNQIRSLGSESFAALSNLTILNLSHNRIGPILLNDTFMGLDKLSQLYLNGNEVSQFETGVFAVIKSLQTLDLSSNRLSNIPDGALSNIKSLTYLYLQDNHLSRVTVDMFRNLSLLLVINLKDNQIETIDNHAFNTIGVESLDLSGNRIVNITTKTFTNSSLKYLNLSRNRIETLGNNIFFHLGEVVCLDVSFNLLTELGDSCFSGLLKVQKIFLQGNQFTKFPSNSVKYMFQLGELDFSNNLLTTLDNISPSGGLTQLKKLNLSGNKLQNFTTGLFISMVMLEVVDISHNDLTSVSVDIFRWLRACKVLNFSYNQLKKIDFTLTGGEPESDFPGLATLTHLDFSHNLITELAQLSFQNSPRLLHINISHNLLSEVLASTFGGNLPVLYTVDLSHNHITYLRPYVFLNSFIKQINLSSNRLNDSDLSSGLSELSFLDDLIELDISNNYISLYFLSTISLPQLKVFSAKGNVITKLSNLTVQTGESSILGKIPSLEVLDLSANPIETLQRSDFVPVSGTIKLLKLENMPQLTHLDKDAFTDLIYLESFHLHGLPQMNSLPVSDLIKPLESLGELHIEIKEPSMRNQLAVLLPQLHTLSITGERLEYINVWALSKFGLYSLMTSGDRLSLSVKNTGITSASITPHLFTNFFLSDSISFGFASNLVADVGADTIYQLRRLGVKSVALSKNPLQCGCDNRELREWMIANLAENKLELDVRIDRQNVFAVYNLCDQLWAPDTLRAMQEYDLILHDITHTTCAQETTPMIEKPADLFSCAGVGSGSGTGDDFPYSKAGIIIGSLLGFAVLVCIIILILLLFVQRRHGSSSRKKYLKSGAGENGLTAHEANEANHSYENSGFGSRHKLDSAGESRVSGPVVVSRISSNSHDVTRVDLTNNAPPPLRRVPEAEVIYSKPMKKQHRITKQDIVNATAADGWRPNPSGDATDREASPSAEPKIFRTSLRVNRTERYNGAGVTAGVAGVRVQGYGRDGDIITYTTELTHL